MEINLQIYTNEIYISLQNYYYFIPVMQSWIYSSITPHGPSEIILTYWFAAQETFILIINIENISTTHFRGNWDTQSKITAFIWNVNHL